MLCNVGGVNYIRRILIFQLLYDHDSRRKGFITYYNSVYIAQIEIVWFYSFNNTMIKITPREGPERAYLSKATAEIKLVEHSSVNQ